MTTMADSISVGNLPPGYGAYAGYAGGNWPTYGSGQLARRFPGATLLSIAVNAGEDATCLDVEPGDATASQAPAWVHRQMARGVLRPVLYSSISNMPAVIGALAGAGIARSSVRLWSAHYEGSTGHICGPYSCKYQGASTPACDGTQWSDTQPGLGGSQIDASMLLPGFFGSIPVSPAANAAPTWFSATPYPNAINFGWNQSATAHAGVTTYHFQLLQAGRVVADQRTTATHASVSGLQPSTAYEWQVATGQDAWHLASPWSSPQPVSTT